MVEDFQRTDFNVFDEIGIAATECNENKRIILKNVDKNLKPHVIDRMMSQFGKIIHIDIPKNQETFAGYKENFVYVFVEFSQFSEAEKAVRELNDRKNKSLGIRADFAYPKRKPQEEKNNITVTVNGLQSKAITKPEEVPHRPQINFDLFKSDNIHEKVTAFERKKVEKRLIDGKQLEILKKQAENSKGEFDCVSVRSTHFI
jgi:RNA recognition motif-containing protein